MLYWLLYQVVPQYFPALSRVSDTSRFARRWRASQRSVHRLAGAVADRQAARVSDRPVHSRRGTEITSKKAGTPTMGGF